MATRLAPRLTKNSAGDYDLLLQHGKFVWAEDGTEVAQHGLERLLEFRGEESLNGNLDGKENSGTYWYDVLFKASTSRAEKELEVKRRILGTPGVVKLLRFDWALTGGELTITGQVLTEFGTVDLSQTIEVL